jgi:pimeloyl-ACP methyl ester carboxylesterase
LITVGGIELNLVDQGHGEAVFLIHGMGLDHRMWEPQVGPLLDAGLRVIRYDARGHGRSSVPDTGYRLVDTQTEALGVLDALGVEKAHMVGLSMGGSIAAHLAVRHPQRCLSVTVMSSMASGYPHLTDFIRLGGTVEILNRGASSLGEYRRQRLHSGLFDRTIDHPAVGEQLRRILLDGLKTTAILGEVAEERMRGWEHPTDWDLWSSGARGVPRLVVAGLLDDDTFTGFARDSASMLETFALLVPGAQHMVNMSHAEEVNRALLGLITGGGPPSEHQGRVETDTAAGLSAARVVATAGMAGVVRKRRLLDTPLPLREDQPDHDPRGVAGPDHQPGP